MDALLLKPHEHPTKTFIGVCPQNVGDEFNFNGRWVVCTGCKPTTYTLEGLQYAGFRISYIFA